MEIELNMKFNNLEEMAQFLRKHGYYVSKTQPVKYVPYPVHVPMPTYPYPPITMVSDTAYDGRPIIQCKNK